MKKEPEMRHNVSEESISQMVNWALANEEQVVLIGENPRKVSEKKRQFDSKWDNLFHVNLTSQGDRIQ